MFSPEPRLRTDECNLGPAQAAGLTGLRRFSRFTHRPDKPIPGLGSERRSADGGVSQRSAEAFDRTDMDKIRDVLTTGDVARICHVAPRTVSKWFDSGQLRGYRIPGSKDRRIPLSHLIRFMRAHGMPLDGLDSGLIRVLLVDADEPFGTLVREGLNRSGFEVNLAGSAFEAGAMAERLRPQVIVVDVSVPELSPKSLVQHIRGNEAMATTRLIAIGSKLGEAESQALKQMGIDACLDKPFDITALVRIIEETVAESPPT